MGIVIRKPGERRNPGEELITEGEGIVIRRAGGGKIP